MQKYLTLYLKGALCLSETFWAHNRTPYGKTLLTERYENQNKFYSRQMNITSLGAQANRSYGQLYQKL